MDIFTFLNPTAPILMEQGEIINGLTSKMWVERYAASGEFTLVGPVSAGLREKLPIGSFVSHTNTSELMIVENHEINDQQDEESVITITGRGFETFLEQRSIGTNKSFPQLISANAKFIVPSDKTWNQIVYLINHHIEATLLVNTEDELPYTTVQSTVTGTGVSAPRNYGVEELYSVIVQLLSVDNLGIKVVRPGVWSPLPGSPSTYIIIHKGVDRTGSVIFSYDTGEIDSADYLWSNKDLKTSALVTGKWLTTAAHLPGSARYQRRWMHVDASDIDENFDEGTALFVIGVLSEDMKQRGLEALKAQKLIALTKAEVSKQSVNSRYRIDFDVGDLVTVVGDYNESSTMRVTEFVEIEDKNGSVAYPTLSLDTQES